MATGWLGDLLGLNVRDDTGGDDVELTRRATWRLKGVGVSVEDKPDEELTEVTFLQVVTDALADLAVTTAKLAANAVTDAKLRQSTARSVIGRAQGSDGNVADITANIDDRLLARTGGVLGWVQLNIGMIPDALITAAKLTGVLEMSYVAVSSSRTLQAGDYYKTIRVDSTSGAVTITLPKTSTLAVPVGTSGLIRWNAGGNDVGVAAEDGTVTVNSSGSELKVARQKGQIYWELEAANTYWIGGEKKA